MIVFLRYRTLHMGCHSDALGACRFEEVDQWTGEGAAGTNEKHLSVRDPETTMTSIGSSRSSVAHRRDNGTSCPV